MNDKMRTKLHELVAAITELAAVNPSGVGMVISDATAAAKRQLKRADVAEGMERIELLQSAGPKLEFTGRELWTGDYEARGGSMLTLTIYQTQSGKFIAYEERDGSGGEPIARAHVADGDNPLAIMDALQWGGLAKGMAQALKWNLRVEID